MEFRIADTFTDSLARLTGDEQKAVKTTAFDLQLNPASPGMSFHKLDKAKDKNFWSVRVSSDIRLIVHKTAGSLLLCYVDHHDKAYDWAERRKLETHPEDRRRAVGRDPRDGAGNRRPDVRGGGNAEAGSREEAAVRPNLRRRSARLRRAGRVAGRRSIRHRGHASRPDRSFARRGRGGAAGTGHRRQAARRRSLPWPRRIRSIIPTRSAASA